MNLPRRANQISRMANAIAVDRLRVASLRQSVSDRIGYAIAVLLGAWVSQVGAPWAVYALASCYLLAALAAYRRYLTARTDAA